MSFRFSNSFIRLPLLAAMLMGGANLLASPQGLLPVELSEEGYVRVNGDRVKVAIPNAHAMYGVGDQIALIEATPTSYVALAGDDASHQRLCVFPRRQPDGQGTAWVTDQFNLIFGTQARSVPGEISLRPTELLPVVFETETDYQVLCERHGQTFSMVIGKDTPGVSFYEELPLSIVQRVQQRDMAKQRLVPAQQWQSLDSDLSALRLELLANLPNQTNPALRPVDRTTSAPGPGRTVLAKGTPHSDPATGLRAFTRPAAEPLVVPKLSKVYPVRNQKPPVHAEPATSRGTPAEEVIGDRPTPPAAQTPPAVEMAPETHDPPKTLAPAEPAPAPLEPAPQEPVAVAAVVETTPAPARPAPAPEPMVPVAVAPTPPPAPGLAPAPKPEPVEVASADPPPPIIHTAILPSDALPPAKKTEDKEPEGLASTVAEAALKLLIFMMVITIVFFATILLLAKFMNRGPRAKRIKTDEETEANQPPPLPANQHRAPVPPPPPEPIPEAPDAVVEPPAAVRPVNDPSLGTFTGSLDGFSITELIQFLHSSRETGTLFISEPQNPNHANMVFEQGEILHADCGSEAGQPAIQDIFGLRNGFFVFQRQPAVSCPRTVTASTMALLMGVSQSIDEMPVASGVG